MVKNRRHSGNGQRSRVLLLADARTITDSSVPFPAKLLKVSRRTSRSCLWQRRVLRDSRYTAHTKSEPGAVATGSIRHYRLEHRTWSLPLPVLILCLGVFYKRSIVSPGSTVIDRKLDMRTSPGAAPLGFEINLRCV